MSRTHRTTNSPNLAVNTGGLGSGAGDSHLEMNSGIQSRRTLSHSLVKSAGVVKWRRIDNGFRPIVALSFPALSFHYVGSETDLSPRSTVRRAGR